jgi:hypothetical protein
VSQPVDRRFADRRIDAHLAIPREKLHECVGRWGDVAHVTRLGGRAPHGQHRWVERKYVSVATSLYRNVMLPRQGRCG